MKEGVIRCKNLVETCLGFSRLESKTTVPVDLNIQEIIQQATDLIRFRLVESNLNISFIFQVLSNFKISGNPHVLSMTFYLVWSELMTTLSHIELISMKKLNQIPIRLVESSHTIEIHLPEGVKIKDDFYKSKLFLHLCELAKIKTESTLGKIIFHKVS